MPYSFNAANRIICTHIVRRGQRKNSAPCYAEIVEEEKKRKVGRPSTFNEIIRDKIIELAEDGKTNEEIADFIGVHVRTLECWLKKDRQFLWAVKEAKSIADDLVEASLFKKAIGYQHVVDKVAFHDGMVVREEVVEKFPPDTKAAEFWLKNRQPDRWREKKEVELSGAVETKDISLEELLRDPATADLAMQLAKALNSKKQSNEPESQ